MTRFLPTRRALVAATVALGLAAGGAAVLEPAASATSIPALEIAARHAVKASINKERAANHKAALGKGGPLWTSARRHNITMARANVMSHQLPGEPVFTTRMEQAGYNWCSAGENIAWTSDISVHGAVALNQAMYHEKAPNNGHRLNILSTSFRSAGVDVYIDTKHHKLWLTEDFGKTC